MDAHATSPQQTLTSVTDMIEMLETFRQVDPWIPVHTMLAFLLVAESGSKGVLQNELQERLNLSQSAMSRNVLVLSPHQGVMSGRVGEQTGLGLIEIEIPTNNRRMRRLRISPKGSKLLDKLCKIVA